MLAAERAKHQLSDADAHRRASSPTTAPASTVPLTRAELEEMTAPLLRRTVDLTRACLAEAARRGVAAVDRVLLVGGSSRMPAVGRGAARASCGLDPQLHDPDLAVARGAALYGEKKELERMVAADLRTRGRLRDGAPLEDAAAADLDDACRRVADAYGVPLAQVRRAVEIRVDTVVSRGFGVLAVNAQAGRLEAVVAGAPQRPAARSGPAARSAPCAPTRPRSSSPSSSSRGRPSPPRPRTRRC